MHDIKLLRPINQCRHTGLERELKTLFPQGHVRAFKDNSGHIRLVAYVKGAKPVSGLLLASGGSGKHMVKAVYTNSCYRRKGYARQLLAVARATLSPGIVYHGDNLTKVGKLWANGVEGLSNVS